MQLHKNRILFFAFIVWLFSDTSCTLHARSYSPHNNGLPTADALLKQKTKLEESQRHSDTTISDNTDTTHIVDDEEIENSDSKSPNMSTFKKILIGVRVVGLVATALIWAAYKKHQEEERRRQEAQRIENERRGIPRVPTAAEIRENERLWARAEHTAHAAPPAPAELPGPAITTIDDILPANGYWDYEPEQHGYCLICTDHNVNLVGLHNGMHLYCRNCLLNTILTAYQNTRAAFDRITPDGIITLTREDIRRITRGNERMLNTFDIAHHNREHPSVQAQLANVTPEMRQISRPCPHCFAPIQRTEGCRHMTCRCRHEFCWFCQADCPHGAHALPDCRRIS